MALFHSPPSTRCGDRHPILCRRAGFRIGNVAGEIKPAPLSKPAIGALAGRGGHFRYLQQRIHILTDIDLPALFRLGAFPAVYFVPHLVAWNRGVRVATAIFIVNFFVAWTLIGRAARLAWATAAETREEPGGDKTKIRPDNAEKVQAAERICRSCLCDFAALAC
jgi:hypothetical protein